MIVSKMKKTAEAYPGEKVTHIVTVPAYFNDGSWARPVRRMCYAGF